MKSTGRFLLRAACGVSLLCGSGLAMGQTTSSDTSVSVTASPKDAKLEKRIDYRLHHDQKLKARVVNASVSDGVVTLTGSVLSESEKTRAEKLARAKGVTSVDNQIQVEGQQAPAPAATDTSATPSEQQAQPDQVRERTTRVEERTETRTERTPAPSPDQTNTPTTPTDESNPAPAAPKRPLPPQPPRY